ncbi:Fic family protein [Nesterenkonia lacusekhoensis]|uniref:Fic family protein n=2 Tax=Nesterenkonia lacusekhoensis TaxID=150832 RepID=A0ABS4T461_9MICC|nr:Fic family protein [Nesterenkonia lacusekhoensis]
MSAILLRTESASSSQIENLTAGARQLALAELEESRSNSARVVIGNVHAMEAALHLADRLDEDALLTMQRILVQEQPQSENYAGRYRNSLVWVGISGVSPIGASHISPQAEHIAPAMDDLIRFIRRADMPVLLQAALAHAQFETIHPFEDGNGRTGRALVHAMLKGKGLVTSTTAPPLCRPAEADAELLRRADPVQRRRRRPPGLLLHRRGPLRRRLRHPPGR